MLLFSGPCISKIEFDLFDWIQSILNFHCTISTMQIKLKLNLKSLWTYFKLKMIALQFFPNVIIVFENDYQ